MRGLRQELIGGTQALGRGKWLGAELACARVWNLAREVKLLQACTFRFLSPGAA